tara:strand:- start:4459 stop:4569 length:111 start_codon:yes stop_codon:yes gene_type:complete
MLGRVSQLKIKIIQDDLEEFVKIQLGTGGKSKFIIY